MKLRKVLLSDGTSKIEVVSPSPEEIEKRKKNYDEHLKKERENKKRLQESTPEERFSKKVWSYIDKKGDDECWMWKGSVGNHGYGVISHNGKKELAYKVLLRLYNKNIPKRVYVLHKCGNKLCVNPNHLIFSSTKERFWKYVDKKEDSDCWRWTGAKDSYGYGIMKVDGNTLHVHRVSYMLFVGEISEDKPIIRHKCHNKECVNPKHLESGTNQDNSDDDVKSGRSYIHGSKGESHPNCSLSDEDINEVRRRVNEMGDDIDTVAKDFNVSKSHIINVAKNKIRINKNYKGVYKSRRKKGEDNYFAKKTWKEIREIREKYNNGISAVELSNEYDISISEMYNIINNKSWFDETYKKRVDKRKIVEIKYDKTEPVKFKKKVFKIMKN